MKDAVARSQAALRFAFSRPGFVTFRAPDAAAEIDCAFARTWGRSLGQVAGDSAGELARSAWRAFAQQAPKLLERAAHLHVSERELEPLKDARAAADAARRADTIGVTLLEHAPRALPLNRMAESGDIVIDCIAVEPREWWLGWHRAGSPETCWPGGVPRIEPVGPTISRAYFKLVEALLWSGLPVRAGDACVEIGSAPGGSCLALLERGCVVTGVDPAEMDPLVLANPRFTHVRARAKAVKHAVYAGCRWLTVDVHAAPKYTLDTVEAVVTRPSSSIEGVVLTLKLTEPKLAAQLPAFERRIRSWGYAEVRARQLAFNRQEVCLVATHRG